MKNKNPLLDLLTLLLWVVLVYGLQWFVFTGIIEIITFCFGWGFNLAHATLTWLVLVLIWIWNRLRKKEK